MPHIPLTVALNEDAPKHIRYAHYWDPITGTNLSHLNPISGDLRGKDLTNIAKAILDGIIVKVTGEMTLEFGGETRVRTERIIDTDVNGSSSVQSAVVSVGDVNKVVGYVVTTGNFSIQLELSPDGEEWYVYDTVSVNNNRAIIGFDMPSLYIRITCANADVTTKHALVTLHVRI